MHPIQDLFLESFSYALQFDIHSYVDKKFILVKSGCYMLSARDVTPSRRGGFRALAAPLRQVVWPEKFKAGHIDKYDGFSNPKEFIQVYHMVIEAIVGDDWVKANYLPTALSDVARSWLINPPKGSIYTWDQLCTIFIRNF
jgi:hypothetical protein